MSVLHVSLFGRFNARCGERVLTGLDALKVQELFCYLLLYRDRPHPRETLANLLWSESPGPRSKRYLRKALWRLQAGLEPAVTGSSDPLLLLESGWVQFNPAANLWLDVATFEQAFSMAQGVPGTELDAPCAQVLRQAVELYQGDLLEGWYQDWCLHERQRLQHLYLAMLDKLMGYCEARQEYETGLVYGVRILRYDCARERTHRRLMRLHYLAGDRTAALRQYERCVSALEREVSVKPSSRTIKLCEQIRADQLETTATLAPADLPRHLGPLRAILVDLQKQVQQTIQAIDAAMSDRE